MKTQSFAGFSADTPLKPFQFERRAVGPKDVHIEIHYCGVCHSDIHTVRNEWGGAQYPLVPGHEITGIVKVAGPEVSQFKVGDRVGVGCFVDSCRTCEPCKESQQQFCENGATFTYNSPTKDPSKTTMGGYSTDIVVDEKYVLKIPDSLPLDKAAPLLCAGITTYSPLRHWKIKAGDHVAVVGMGGLGHMAVKIAFAMGAKVTVLSHSMKKKEDALKMGAVEFASTAEASTFQKYANKFSFIIDTVSAEHDLNGLLGLLKRDGTMCLVGVPEKPSPVHAFPLIGGRRSLSGSLIGGIKETQEMLNFCAEHKVTPEIEMIPMESINEAYEQMIKGEVRYRYVIDINTLR